MHNLFPSTPRGTRATIAQTRCALSRSTVLNWHHLFMCYHGCHELVFQFGFPISHFYCFVDAYFDNLLGKIVDDPLIVFSAGWY